MVTATAAVQKHRRKHTTSGSNAFWNRMKNGFHAFCDRTSFHGFNQLYYSQTWFWCILWFILIGIAHGMTTYQAIAAISQYNNQGSATVIRVANQDEIVYPPLKLCFTHWLQWVDFEKAYENSFTKESLLYGLSFLTTIYSTKQFNVTEAQINFTETMRMHNLTKLTEFYSIISKYAPLRLWDKEFFGTNYSKYGGAHLKHSEFTKYQMNSLLFCHVQTGDEIKSYIRNAKGTTEYPTNANSLGFALNDQHSFNSPSATLNESEITMREYNSYMAEWIETTTPQYWILEEDEGFEKAKQNYTNFDSPLVLFPDGYSSAGVKIAKEIDEYYITVRASSRVWKNTKSNPCNPDIVSIVSDVSCTQLCVTELTYKSKKTNKTFFDYVYNLDKDKPEMLYSNDIIFINDITSPAVATTFQSVLADRAENETLNQTSFDMLISSVTPNKLTTVTQTSAPAAAPALGKANCTERCLQGCQKWNFDVSVTAGSIYNSIKDLAEKKRTNIQIDYPVDGDIMIMSETDSQSWENFIGSVGGLLGIWTGASILSFIEMIYLCFFANNETDCGAMVLSCQEKKKRVFFKQPEREQPKPVKRIKTIIIKHLHPKTFDGVE